jgi:membrane protease YdiL (CAAX protease family)
MPGPLDFALLILFAVAWPLYTTFVDWPKYVARLRAGVPGVRLKQYVSTIVEQWALVTAAILLWTRGGRSWAALGFGPLDGWRAWVALVLVVGIGTLYVLQVRSVAASAAMRERVRSRLQSLDALVPHTLVEFRTFLALSLTAGICEELLFRGFLIWVLQPWLGAWGAGLLGAVGFGLAHTYQGRGGAIRAGIAGLLMTVVYLVCRSLIPGMVLHALIDMAGGWITWRVLRDAPGAPRPLAAVA